MEQKKAAGTAAVGRREEVVSVAGQGCHRVLGWPIHVRAQGSA